MHVLLILSPKPAFAILEYLTGESGKNEGMPSGEVLGPCGGRALPRNKVRKYSNVRLECSSNSSHYIRSAQNFDYDSWNAIERDPVYSAEEKRKKMQEFRHQNDKPIEWDGAIPYSTHEVWDWVEWYYGPDRAACGCTNHCHTTCSTDDKGNRHCEEHCTCVTNSCWHDEPRHEVQHCSEEVMKYKAHFVRPSTQEWGPHLKEYHDILPNKYDLLPGEVENVQLSNSSGRSATLSPNMEVGDAWNKYVPEINIKETNQARASCEFNKTYNLELGIHTRKRLIKKTPNAFRVPVNKKNNKPDALDWKLTVKDSKEIKTIPASIKLEDVSATMIAALARQSRNLTADLENAREKAGLNSNTSTKEVAKLQEKTQFWKNTQVRVRLFEIRFGRDMRPTTNLYTNDIKAAQKGQYEIDLHGEGLSESLFRSSAPFFQSFWAKLPVHLRPDKDYELLISMFQKGVPFYEQDCESSKKWFCGEGDFYSKELPIGFHTPDGQDERGFVEKVIDFIGASLWQKVTGQF